MLFYPQMGILSDKPDNYNTHNDHPDVFGDFSVPKFRKICDPPDDLVRGKCGKRGAGHAIARWEA
jgi:hypothetical protein